MAKVITEKRKTRKQVVRDESSDSEIVPDSPIIIPAVSLPTMSVPLKIVITKSVPEEAPIWVPVSLYVLILRGRSLNVFLFLLHSKLFLLHKFRCHPLSLKFWQSQPLQHSNISYNSLLQPSFNPNLQIHQKPLLMMKQMEEFRKNIWRLTFWFRRGGYSRSHANDWEAVQDFE